jgi:hypothetical protein
MGAALRTVLVVDDDEYERESIADVLEFFGYRVVTARVAQRVPDVGAALMVTCDPAVRPPWGAQVIVLQKPVELRQLTSQVRELCPLR